jgi:glycosyltransferase involved in cell wall biosynthesis
MTLISVALPVYNGADYLSEALDSIITQDYADFELVVSDNCSTDETPQILADYAHRDKRIRVSRTKSLIPQAANVNRAVELCDTTWVKLFCHDDIMLSGCLSALHQAVTDEDTDNVGLVGNDGGWRFSNGYSFEPLAGTEARVISAKGPALLQSIFGGVAEVNVPSLTTAMVKKEVWEKSGKFDGRYIHFDTFLWMRILTKWDYLFVTGNLTITRIHSMQVAVSARKSLQSVRDNRLFWPEFLDEFKGHLNLNATTRLKIRLKPLAAAGTIIAIEVIKGDLGSATKFFLHMPFLWWPLLPAFALRSFMRETIKIQPLRSRVTAQEIYP